MPHHKRRRSRPPEATPLIVKAAKALELPAEIFYGMAHMELSGNREIVIDGCKGVLEYDENVIRLNTGALSVRFLGHNLSIRSFTRDTAVVEGYISSIEFFEQVK